MIPEDVIDKALEVAGKSTSNYEYFFSRLTSPDWLEPLLERGFFRDPRGPIREGDTVRYPLWPESRYLARVADKAPEKVLQIALQVVPETDNIRVHEDLARAAVNMPPSMAAIWVRKEMEWLKGQRLALFLLPDELSKLISYLAKGGEIDTALALARLLLELRAPDKKPADEEAIRWPANPILRVDPYDYSELLRLRVPDLVEVRPIETLEMLSDQLESAIRIHMRQDEDTSQPPTDYSYIWRPAVEEHEQNAPRGPYDIKELLTSTIRDISERLIDRNPSMLPRLLERLEGRGWDIFRRIALHLLRRFPHLEEAGPLIAERLVSEERLRNIGEQHEYALLLRDQFHQLKEEQRAKILETIDTGFDAEGYMKGFEAFHKRIPTEEDVAAARDHWRLRRLSFIADSLPAKWKKQYEALVAAHGAPEHAEFPSYSVGWVGPTSPKTNDELSSMTVEELTDYLREWRSVGGFDTPSREGLSRGIAAQVGARADEFARNANQFVGLDPTYVRAIFEGLAKAAGEEPTFKWPAVLRLARWVVDQPREIPGREERRPGDEIDPNWDWTRKAIARLLGTGFESQTAPFPAELRALAWEILRLITDDPEPTPEYEERYGGSNMDPLTLSINTTRGEAMHAVVRYCLWVRRQIEAAADAEDRLRRGFDEMPEAREVLDTHLDPARDPSMAIRAVYGQWLPWLALLDETWANTNLSRIFPEDPGLLALREAAWDTYIVMNKAYTNLLELLHDQYGWAIDRMGSESRIKSHLGDPDKAVASHLMVYYWQGKLDPDDPDGLLARFYTKAPDSVRGHAIDFIGRNLTSTPDTPRRVANRLRRLWERRLAEASAADRKEMAAFGWWFISERFEDEWLLTNLREALRKAGKVESAHKVVERLAQIAGSFPLAAVECLGYMVRGDEEGWGVQMWRDNVKAILAAALASADPEARKAARALTHELGARGHWHFRELLAGESTLS